MEFNRWSDNAEKVMYLLCSIMDLEFDDRLWQIVDPKPSPADVVFNGVDSMLCRADEDTDGGPDAKNWDAEYAKWQLVAEACIDRMLLTNYGIGNQENQ